MRTRRRIVTFRKKQGKIKKRFFVIRKISYDDSMTPMYATPLEEEEKRYDTIREILDNSIMKHLILYPILDLDHSLKTWDNEIFIK